MIRIDPKLDHKIDAAILGRSVQENEALVIQVEKAQRLIEVTNREGAEPSMLARTNNDLFSLYVTRGSRTYQASV